MGNFGEPSKIRRNTTFERVEERFLMTARPVGDFFLDPRMIEASEAHTESVHASLADVHNISGVNHSREMYGFDGRGQTVVVIDSGIAYDHYALGGGIGDGYRVVGGWDFTEENDSNPYDDGPGGFHGTHVAGIIGSSDSVHSGVAPGVDLVGLRVFNDQGAGFFEWVEDALSWVHNHRDSFEHPITTVNMSLGASWNSDSIPSWAMLEDELALLHDDGIFVSVAAGNDFQEYFSPGLSYPAASPYVVPVASVTNSGHFSGFSQRSSQVLAAPGQNITSTVPDYLFDFNGSTDDFATASGTSMAAPYVAGVSTLVRQAMEFAGHANITQDSIYDHLRNTAVSFWDPATNDTYRLIDVQTAVDTLMPPDDYPATATGNSMNGTISNLANIEGSIETLHDQDGFSFVADVSGTLDVAVSTTHQLVPILAVDGTPLTLHGGVASLEVITNQTYALTIHGDGEGIGHYDIELTLSAETDSSGIPLGFVNQGIAARDNAHGIGFVMFSEESVFSRFSDAAPLAGNSDHLVAVQYASGRWHYDNNSVLRTFTPRDSDVLLAKLDFSQDSVTSLAGMNTSQFGIAKGFEGGDIEFIANLWGNQSNQGEFTVRGSHFTRSTTNASGKEQVSLGTVHLGIATSDHASGIGYIMYSQEHVFSRFSESSPLPGNSDHLIAVRHDGNQWLYNNNHSWRPFSIQASDQLLAQVDFSQDTITSLEGNIGAVSGISQGFSAGDLTFFANRWGPSENAGEFRIDGTFFTRSDNDQPDVHQIDVGQLGYGIAVRDGGVGEGYIMFSEEDVFSRFVNNTPFVGNSKHLIAVQNIGGNWYYDNNTSLHQLAPRATDVLIAEINLTGDSVTSLANVNDTVFGMARGYSNGDLEFAANDWGGSYNVGEFRVVGSFFTRCVNAPLTQTAPSGSSQSPIKNVNSSPFSANYPIITHVTNSPTLESVPTDRLNFEELVPPDHAHPSLEATANHLHTALADWHETESNSVENGNENDECEQNMLASWKQDSSDLDAVDLIFHGIGD